MSRKTKLMILGGFLILATLWAYLSDSGSDTEVSTSMSSLSAAPAGTKALYLLLSELDLPVSRWRYNLTQLANRRGTLVVMWPDMIPFSGREVKRIKEWVKKGNRLVILEGGEKPKPESHLIPERARKFIREKKSDGMSLASGLGLRSKTSTDQSRRVVSVDSPRFFGVKTLSVSSRNRWEGPPKAWTSLVADDDGPLVVAQSMGNGEVVALSDATIASNRFIASEDNVRFLSALLLEKGRPQEIYIDEYHHGHVLAADIWEYVGSSVFACALLQIVIGSLLFFYSRMAIRAGRYRSLSTVRGRSSLEYVDSMANFLESAKADSVALDAVLRRFLVRLSRRTGIPLRMLENGGPTAVSLRAADGADPAKLIGECRKALAHPHTVADALTLAQKLAAESNRWR